PGGPNSTMSGISWCWRPGSARSRPSHYCTGTEGRQRRRRLRHGSRTLDPRAGAARRSASLPRERYHCRRAPAMSVSSALPRSSEAHLLAQLTPLIRPTPMTNRQERLVEFFERYSRASLGPEPERLAELYDASFLAAGHRGVAPPSGTTSPFWSGFGRRTRETGGAA